MHTLDEILRASRLEPKTFHPANERSEQSWFPGNEAASLLLQCSNIWDDIECLAQVRVATEGVYARKLMIKYLIIEIRSLIEIIDRLRAQVMKAPVFNPTKESVWRGITEAEHQRSRELFKEYSSVKLSVEGSIIQIRDNIGAHRGNVDWQQVMRFWDEISMETVSPLLEVVPRVFEHVKELDIYEWNRTPVDGVIEFIGGTLRPESRQAKI